MHGRVVAWAEPQRLYHVCHTLVPYTLLCGRADIIHMAPEMSTADGCQAQIWKMSVQSAVKQSSEMHHALAGKREGICPADHHTMH